MPSGWNLEIALRHLTIALATLASSGSSLESTTPAVRIALRRGIRLSASRPATRCTRSCAAPNSPSHVSARVRHHPITKCSSLIAIVFDCLHTTRRSRRGGRMGQFVRGAHRRAAGEMSAPVLLRALPCERRSIRAERGAKTAHRRFESAPPIRCSFLRPPKLVQKGPSPGRHSRPDAHPLSDQR